MTEGDMKEVAALLARAVQTADDDASAFAEIRAGVRALVDAHPAYAR
jgi:hypothetical protein